MAAKKLYYKIGEACRAVDIQPYVLRYWETEFPALAPDKSSSGQRVYTEEEITLIRRIKELLYDEGYTIAGAKKRLETELEQPGGVKAKADSGDDGSAEDAQDEADADEESVEDEDDEADEQDEPDDDVDDPSAVDTRALERIETLEEGVGRALREVRELLASLDESSDS